MVPQINDTVTSSHLRIEILLLSKSFYFTVLLIGVLKISKSEKGGVWQSRFRDLLEFSSVNIETGDLGLDHRPSY